MATLTNVFLITFINFSGQSASGELLAQGDAVYAQTVRGIAKVLAVHLGFEGDGLLPSYSRLAPGCSEAIEDTGLVQAEDGYLRRVVYRLFRM